uniref:Uncharacterized protein n=1 Tax=Ciona intestinalis TaxID=7719 RepID=H2XYP8_CIOIN
TNFSLIYHLFYRFFVPLFDYSCIFVFKFLMISDFPVFSFSNNNVFSFYND